MTKRTITALYDTRAEAEATRENLRQVGVPESSIIIEDASRAEADRDHLAALPDEDRHAYEEGLRRGGFLVTVHADSDYDEDAIRVLEETPALDFDDRQDQWRASGWAGYQLPQTNSGPDATATPRLAGSGSLPSDNVLPSERLATEPPKPASRAAKGGALSGDMAPVEGADADEDTSPAQAEADMSSLPSSKTMTADYNATSPLGGQDGVESGYYRIARAVRDARESKRVRSYSYPQPEPNAAATVPTAPATFSSPSEQAPSSFEHAPTTVGSGESDSANVRMPPSPARSSERTAASSLGPLGAIIGLIAVAAATIWALRGRSHQQLHRPSSHENSERSRHPRYVANQVADPLFEDDRGAGTDGAYTGGMVGDRSLGSGPGVGGASGR